MTLWQALVTINSARHGLSIEDMTLMMPELEKIAVRSLRQLGMTREEMNREYSDRSLYNALYLIKHDPEEFERRSDLAQQRQCARN